MYVAAAGPVRPLMETTMAGLWARLKVVCAAAMVALPLAACGVNNVPRLEEQAKAAWGEVQNQYQRRADLIPNLVETVKGYAQQEKDVLTQVTEARAKATSIQLSPDIVNNT